MARTKSGVGSTLTLLVLVGLGIVVARGVNLDNTRQVRLHANWNGGLPVLVQWGVDGAMNTVVDKSKWLGDQLTNDEGIGQFDRTVPYQSGHRYTIRIIPSELGLATCSIVVMPDTRVAYDSASHRPVICTVPLKN